MDISSLTQYLSIVVVGICLCVGYIIKNSLDFIPNKYIPLIMGILGLIINILINLSTGITAEVVLGGLFSGLASTGLYEMFRNLINKEWFYGIFNNFASNIAITNNCKHSSTIQKIQRKERKKWEMK